MARVGIEPVVVTLSPEPENSLASAFDKAEVIRRSLNFGRLAGLVIAQRRLNQLLDELKPDVIHSQGARADSIVSQLSGVRLCTQRNDPFQDYVMKFGNVVGYGLALRHVYALRRMPQVVSCSTAIQRVLAEYKVNSVVINNGVDVEHFSSPLPGNGVRFYRRIDDGRLLAVVVGELSKRKDPLTVLRALAAGAKARWKVLFVGDGPLKDSCLKYVQDSDLEEAVSFCGQVADVRPYLRAADIQLSASWGEGYPNSVLEAFSVGLPAVLSDIEPHREVSVDMPGMIDFFTPGDHKMLARTLQRWRPSCTREMVRKGAVERLSSDRMVEQYIELYSSLIGR